MDLEWAIEQLEANAAAIRQMVQSVSPEQARMKPAPESWSLLEVVNHLVDEEREDFRQRLDLTLHQPETEWPPIDPEGWVKERGYQQRELLPSIENFVAERQRSLAWLRGLESPDLTITRRHPSGMTMRAGDLLAAWVAHDLLHMRQIVEIHHAAVVHNAQPYSTEYAGEW